MFHSGRLFFRVATRTVPLWLHPVLVTASPARGRQRAEVRTPARHSHNTTWYRKESQEYSVGIVFFKHRNVIYANRYCLDADCALFLRVCRWSAQDSGHPQGGTAASEGIHTCQRMAGVQGSGSRCYRQTDKNTNYTPVILYSSGVLKQYSEAGDVFTVITAVVPTMYISLTSLYCFINGQTVIYRGDHFPQASREICSPCVLSVKDWYIDSTCNREAQTRVQ